GPGRGARARGAPVPRRPPMRGPRLPRAAQPQGLTAPGFTPRQTTSRLTQPAWITTSRLSLVIGTGVSKIEAIGTLRGPSAHVLTPGSAAALVPLASAIADSPALLPTT